MADTTKQSSRLRSWHAETWDQLSNVGQQLLPELLGEGFDQAPSFANEHISQQEAGTVFERFVLEAFRLSGAEVHDPFPVTSRSSTLMREQIDGLVILDRWCPFLIESKLWKDKVVFDPIALLHHRTSLRPTGTLAVFFSAFGYTEPAVESAQYLQPLRVLLFDGRELRWALNRENLIELVRKKWVAAVKHGDPYYPVID